MFNIYEYIENYKLNPNNLLEFAQTLCNCFSQKFQVTCCPIKIVESETPPARYNISLKKQNSSLYEKTNEAIELSSKLLTSQNKARVVKLIAHEWMHFYDYLFKTGTLNINNAQNEYRELLLKSHEFDSIFKTIKTKYQDKHIIECINKLSSSEVLADKHAQSFLKDLYKNTTDEKLKKQIKDQINKHEEQIQSCISTLKDSGIKEPCIVYEYSLE